MLVLAAAFAFVAGAAATATITTDVKMLSYNAQVRIHAERCCWAASTPGNISSRVLPAHK